MESWLGKAQLAQVARSQKKMEGTFAFGREIVQVGCGRVDLDDGCLLDVRLPASGFAEFSQEVSLLYGGRFHVFGCKCGYGPL